MCAQADAGPIRGLPGIREWVAVFAQCGDELMDQVRMRATMASALGETEMRFLAQIINAFSGESANWSGQKFCIIRSGDFFCDLHLGQFGGVQNVRLVFY